MSESGKHDSTETTSTKHELTEVEKKELQEEAERIAARKEAEKTRKEIENLSEETIRMLSSGALAAQRRRRGGDNGGEDNDDGTAVWIGIWSFPGVLSGKWFGLGRMIFAQ